MPTLYKINPRLGPMITRFYEAGLLEHHITMDNWDRYAQSHGYKDAEAFLALLPADRAAEWRLLITESVSERKVEEPKSDEHLKVMLISQELQEIVDKELSGYKVKLEKSEK